MFNSSLLTGFLCYPTLAVHRNSSQLSTLILVVSGINIALSITATLGNALILVALRRESSLYPPSKLFLRCLAFSDLCVGLIVQPVAVVSLLSAVYHRWDLCRVGEFLWYPLGILMAEFSLATLTAISVDRLLALVLGMRYRQVVTIRRARLLIALFLLMPIVNCALQYIDFFAFLSFGVVILLSWLITSIYCYVRIYLVLRNHIQAQVTQEQQKGISQLNLLRYKKTVSTVLWVFATMIICYAPFGLILIANTTLSELNGSLVALTFFCNNANLFKFIAESHAVLLEDQRGETCS
ncbi:hypothetical protein ACROYT_G003375 [Oculina patagonica]